MSERQRGDCVAGAAGLRAARWRRNWSGAIRGSSSRGDLAQRRRHAARPAPSRATGSRSSSPSSTSTTLEDVDAAIVAYPHGASAPVVAALRGLGVQVVDLSADFRLRDIPTYEHWYGAHGDPDLLESAVYGLTELDRERIRDADLVANPGCYPTAALLALAPLAERGPDRGRGHRREVRGLGRRPRRRASELAFVNLDGEHRPYAVDGHRHQPEIEQELRRLGAARRVTFVPHLLPLDQGLLASCYVDLAEPLDAERARRALRRALRGRALRRGGRRRRPECATSARRTSAGSTRRARAAQGGGLRRDRQPLEGRRRPGGAEPEPDAGARRDRGAAVSAQAAGSADRVLPLALGRGSPRGVEELDPAALAPGFRAAGVACGLKAGRRTDVGIVACDADYVALVVAADAQRRRRRAGAGLPRRTATRAAIRAAVVNSGNANAATGERGYRDAAGDARRRRGGVAHRQRRPDSHARRRRRWRSPS